MSRCVSVSAQLYGRLSVAAAERGESLAKVLDRALEGVPQPGDDPRFPRRGKNAVPSEDVQAEGLGLACAAWLIRKHLAVVSPDREPAPAAATEAV
jgi:hypothetical protein